MKFNKIFLIASTAFILFSCQKKTEIEATNLELDSAGTSLVNPESTNQSINNPAVTQSVTIPQTNTPASGLNPEHGQPGHRCDIPVGAPLNSTVQKKPANPTQQITVNPTNTTPVTPTKQQTAPGMNPPHGEPGHRCDIPVGQPLNSKPVTNNVQPTTTNTTSLPVTVAAPENDANSK